MMMNLSLWYGFWSGVACGLWLAGGIAFLKLRQEAKRRAWRLPSVNQPSSASMRMGLPAMMLAATPLDQNTGTPRRGTG
jgi:hypothetical protein